MMTDDKNEDGLSEETFAAEPEATGEEALAAALLVLGRLGQALEERCESADA